MGDKLNFTKPEIEAMIKALFMGGLFDKTVEVGRITAALMYNAECLSPDVVEIMVNSIRVHDRYAKDRLGYEWKELINTLDEVNFNNAN